MFVARPISVGILPVMYVPEISKISISKKSVSIVIPYEITMQTAQHSFYIPRRGHDGTKWEILPENMLASNRMC